MIFVKSVPPTNYLPIDQANRDLCLGRSIFFNINIKFYPGAINLAGNGGYCL